MTADDAQEAEDVAPNEFAVEGERAGEDTADTEKVEAFFAEAEEELGAGDAEDDDEEEEKTVLPGVLLSLLMLDAPDQAAGLLIELPLHLQGQSLERLVSCSPLSVTRELEPEERTAVEELRERLSGREEWGVQTACDILRAIDDTRRLRRALGAMAGVDEEAVTVLQNHLFVFEDIQRLDDREMQAVLATIDNTTVAESLKMTTEAIQERILSNVSDRRRRLIEEEGELTEGASIEEIELAQGNVLSAVRYMYEQGEISTYFGSIPGENPTSASADEEEDGEDEGEEKGERGPSQGQKKKRRSRPAKQRSLSIILLAGAVVVGAPLLTMAVLHFTVPRRTMTETTDSSGGERVTSSGGSSGASKSGKVLIAREGASAIPKSGGNSAGRPSPSADEAFSFPDAVKALLIMPERDGEQVARVLVSEGSEVGEVGSGRADESAVESTAGEGDVQPEEETALELRVGRMKVAVLDPEFAVRTPVAEIKGADGSVFEIRVVLDATTTVTVQKGTATLNLPGEGRGITVPAGHRCVVSSGGDVELEEVEK